MLALSKSVLAMTTLLATALACPEAKAQSAPNLPEIVARDLGANGVLGPEPRIPGSPVILQPFGIVVTGDGQMGTMDQSGTPAAQPRVTTDGRALFLGYVFEQDDPVADALQ